MLEIQGLTVAYGGVAVLEDFHLTVAPGQVVALVGESGSGKTTAVRTVLGLLPPGGAVTAGSVTLDGRDLLALPPKAWRGLRGREIAMIFQDTGAMMNPIRTVGSQFCEYLRCHEKMTRQEARRRSVQLLERMGLPDAEGLLKTYPFQLSGGQRQRVGIAMAMAFRPRLLLADEPTSALDVTTQAQIVQQMLDLKRDHGTAILLVTHNLAVAAYLADQLLVLQNGRVVDRGDREKILRHAAAPYTRELLEAVPDLRREPYV